MAWHWRHPENGRWQELQLESDIFNSVVLVTRAGGVRMQRLTIHRYPVATRKELRRRLRELNRRRARHGYAKISVATYARLNVCENPLRSGNLNMAGTISGKAVLSTGELSQRLGVTVTAAFIKKIGFLPAAERLAAATYWYETDFDGICSALANHFGDLASAKAPKCET